MKTLTTATILLAASMIAMSQANASSQQMGQTYDPQNDYYENYNLSGDKSGVNSSAAAVSVTKASETPASTALGLDWPYGDDEKIVLSQTSYPAVAEKVAQEPVVMDGFSFPYGF